MSYRSISDVIKAIKQVKIQGAEAVSEESLKALKYVLHKSNARTKENLISEMESAREKLVSSRPTEPFLRNSLNSVFRNFESEDLRGTRELFFKNIQNLLKHIEFSRNEIIEIGSKKIKKGMVVFTHCHSSTVSSILIHAKKQGKRFTVHNTETRPLFQGRKTAKELAKNNIKVFHYIDSAARLALKKADIMLIGADAITTEGRVINKIGSEMFAEIAHNYHIPVYVCTNSWKFDPKTIFGFEEEIEKRSPKEVWAKPPKNVTIDNHAFEIINPNLITGVITELGIYEPQILVQEIRREYNWLIGER